MRDPILRDFEDLLRARPQSVLIAGIGHAATVTEVDALARAVERTLRAAGQPPGTVVGLASPDGPLFLAALLAVLRSELVALLLDAWSPAPERARIAAALGAPLVLRGLRAWPTGEGDWEAERVALERPPRRLPGCAVVKLTSGTTGTPRGVATPAAALAADDDQLFRSMGLNESDRLLSAVPLGHSYGLSSLAVPALRRGVPLLLPEQGSPFAPLELARALGATFFPTTPAWLHGLLRVAEPPAWPETLRLTISAGAPLAGETAARFREVFGRRVHTFYGSSECGGICYDRDGDAAESGTVGAPIDGVRIELQPVEGVEVPGAAEVGIVTVRSASVARGYTPEPDARLADGRFVAGDLASWRGGALCLAGRVDDLINVHGKKVSPREVEAVLRQLPGVEDAIVVGVPQPGTGGQWIRAVLAVPPDAADAPPTAAEAIAFCRARLAAHKVPRSVVLVAEIPRTPRGKIDRRALLDLATGAP